MLGKLWWGRSERRRDKIQKECLAPLLSLSQPQASFAHILNTSCKFLDAESGALILVHNNHFEVEACQGLSHYTLKIEESRPFINWLKHYRRPVTKLEIIESPEMQSLKTAALNLFIPFQAEICLPLLYREDLLGWMHLGPRKKGSYDKRARRLLETLSLPFSMALANMVLRQQVIEKDFEISKTHELKNQMLANLSHELRTPLTSVIGFAELLAEEVDGSLSDTQREHVGRIIEGANRLLYLLSTLMDLAKLESGLTGLQVQQFSLTPIVEEILEEIPLGAAIQRRVDLNGTTPRVYGDANLVRQIFKHILENAAKYTETGHVAIKAVKKGEMLELCVEDTGVGIAQEKLGLIFQGFYQADGGASRSFQGPGLGLAVSKKLVELHGGRLWAQSQAGRGSRFYFTLPLKPVTIKHRELVA